MTRGGAEVILLDPWKERVDPRHIRELEAFKDVFDLIIVAMKSYDTKWVIDLMKPYLSDTSYFVSPQNSINEKQIASLVGADRIIRCVRTIPAWLMGPDHIRQTGSMSQALKGNISLYRLGVGWTRY
jgi:2-dehydropantoate 2-reductase